MHITPSTPSTPNIAGLTHSSGLCGLSPEVEFARKGHSVHWAQNSFPFQNQRSSWKQNPPFEIFVFLKKSFWSLQHVGQSTFSEGVTVPLIFCLGSAAVIKKNPAACFYFGAEAALKNGALNNDRGKTSGDRIGKSVNGVLGGEEKQVFVPALRLGNAARSTGVASPFICCVGDI